MANQHPTPNPSEMEFLSVEKIRAEIGKLMAETAKINRESQWHPVMVAAALIGATAAVVKLFF